MSSGTPVSFKMKEYDELKCSSGSANRKSMKTCYLQIKGFMESQVDEHKMASRKFIYRMKQVVNSSLRGSNFKKKFLVDPLIKDSFESTGECFFTVEFTFFGEQEELDRKECTIEMNRIANNIFNQVIKVEKDLKFSRNVKHKTHGKK